MSDLIKIAVDAMGGDGSPKKIIDGIILNHSTNKAPVFPADITISASLSLTL